MLPRHGTVAIQSYGQVTAKGYSLTMCIIGNGNKLDVKMILDVAGEVENITKLLVSAVGLSQFLFVVYRKFAPVVYTAVSTCQQPHNQSIRGH